MTGDCHVRFYESLGVRFPRATHRATQHTAKFASTSKTGLFAPLCGRLRAAGSSAPLRSLIAAPLMTLCALLALSAASAQAEPPKLISYGNFPSEGPGIAIDQSSGDVFTAGLVKFENGVEVGNGHLNEFDAAGKLISPPSPFAENNWSDVAVNPSNGDLYALSGLGVLETYDPTTGARLSAFEVPSSRNIFGVLTVVQIGVDSTGDVYVPVIPENKVLEYKPSECPALPKSVLVNANQNLHGRLGRRGAEGTMGRCRRLIREPVGGRS